MEQLENDLTEEREFIWKQKRCGKLTASMLDDVIDRKNDYKKTATARKALWILVWERRNGKVRHQQFNKNFDWGHDNEGGGIECVRAEMPMNTIKDCSKDYDEIQFREQLPGCGDSPDADIYDFGGNIEGIIEVKCPVDEAKIEMHRGRTELTEKDEYFWQCINHFIGTPSASYLLFVEYDAYVNEANIIRLERADYLEQIEFLTAKLTNLNILIDMAVKGQFKF